MFLMLEQTTTSGLDHLQMAAQRTALSLNGLRTWYNGYTPLPRHSHSPPVSPRSSYSGFSFHLSLRCTCTRLHPSHFRVWAPMCPLSRPFLAPYLDLQALPPHSLFLPGFIFSSTLSPFSLVFYLLVGSVYCLCSACRLGEP